MKFAHEFKETLEREDFPDHWRAAAIPYSQLKKCLKKVQRELEQLGLDKDTLQHLLAEQTITPSGEPVPLACYNLDKASPKSLRPRLSVFVHLQHGQVVDAALSPASRSFLCKLSGQHATYAAVTPPRSDSASPPSDDQFDLALAHDPGLERIEIPLVFDGEFFNMLQTDVDSLSALQMHEETCIESDIRALGSDLAHAAHPPKRFSKTDLNRWREIFSLYLDAQVFFSSYEIDHGSRTSAQAVKQLVWFQKEVQDRDLLSKFKVPSSRLTYNRFLHINAILLKNLKFQELNKLALTKILKKFDKRTSLGASASFRAAVRSQRLLAGSVAKKLCAELSEEVVLAVPRVEDYFCPICFSIAWYPVRLQCLHLFCVRCVVKMQRENEKNCPLCRDEVVMQADLDNIDEKLQKYMRQYFRKETDEKQKANEIESGRELFGDEYRYSKCTVM